MALIWIFNLRSERESTRRRKKINANSCAFRTWQIPAALLLAFGYHTVLFAGEIWGALTRRYEPLPDVRPAARQLPLAPESIAPAAAVEPRHAASAGRSVIR